MREGSLDAGPSLLAAPLLSLLLNFNGEASK